MKKIITLILIITLAAILRLYRLPSNPPSLYWDEVSLGYNAYSIAQEGLDEHGEIYPKARFIAFGDFKPPGYIYATVLPIKILGLNEFSVRLPSAFAGILLTLVTFYLAILLTRSSKLSYLASFLVAVSPWSIQLSRGAFEANLAALFNVIAILFFLKFVKGKGVFLVLSTVFFILSFYTFNANRIIAPSLLIIFSLIYFKSRVVKEKKWLVFAIVLAVFLTVPSVNYLLSRESKVRFQEVSIFTNLKPLLQANDRIKLHNNSALSRVLHNRRVEYTKDFLIHFADHFKADFLFFSGDVNPRLSTRNVGLTYLVFMPFFILGILLLVKNYPRVGGLFLIWVIVSIFPAALSKETPHALRTASIMPVYEIITACGLFFVFKKISFRKPWVVILITLLFTTNIFYYLHDYHIHYPVRWASEWQYGYKQAVQSISKIEDNYDHIVVTESLGRPYIYFLFFQKINPKYYLQVRNANRDWFGFWTVEGFGKYQFGLEKLPNLTGRVLVLGKPQESQNIGRLLETIIAPDGNPVLVISEK